MNDKEKAEFKRLFSAYEKRKKRITIILSIMAVVVLLLAIYLIAFRIPAPREQAEAPKQEAALTTKAPNTKAPDTKATKEVAATKAPASETPVESDTGTPVQVQSVAMQNTGYAPLDGMVNSILSNITYDGMSSNDKLYAIYNYVSSNMSYNMSQPTSAGVYEELLSLGYSEYDSSQMTLTYNAASYGQGVCDDYAALTMILARAAGIPLFQSGGLSASGSSHAWNTLIVDGEKYLIDTNYGIFMKRFSDSGYTEQMDGSNFFNYFNTYIPPVEERKISWMFNAGFGSQRFMGNDRGEITQTATINRPMYPDPPTIYPEPITPMVTAEGGYNTFSATVSSGGAVIETLAGQSGDNQMYYFSWYPPNPGSYVVEITMNSDDILTGHFIIYADITE